MQNQLHDERSALEAIEDAVGLHRLRSRAREDGRVTKLEFLFCKVDQLPPEIGSLKDLRELTLLECSELTQINPEMFSSLRKLKTLEIIRCRNLTEILPIDGTLHQLQELRICYCRNLISLPSGIGSLSNLKILELSLKKVPPEIGRLSRLKELCLYDCFELAELPKEVGRLESLRVLHIKGCDKITSLPPELGMLSNLETVRLFSCQMLKRLPAELLSAPKLKHLKIMGCPRLTITIQDMSHLSCSVTEMRFDDDFSVQQMLDVYNGWNRAGRYLLKSTKDVPDGLWPMVFEHVRKVQVPFVFQRRELAASILFLFLREKPSLFKNAASSSGISKRN